MTIASVFLSGWEYNRLCSPDPFKPMVSALPAQVLWDGSAQFWLFEKIYCTKEAFETEIESHKQLEWTTGLIFSDLKRRGFLEPISIAERATSDPILKLLTEVRHADLRKRYSDASIMEMLRHGDEAQLEAIKSELLAPLFEHLKCVGNISPNSIKHWINGAENRHLGNSRSDEMVQLIAEPIIRQKEPWRIGTRLCNPPGTGLDKKIMHLQQETEKRIQTPLIPELLAGKLSLNDYLKELNLKDTEKVYKPVNEQLLKDYNCGIQRLERMRDIARTELWRSSARRMVAAP